jgi:hypothetical protein
MSPCNSKDSFIFLGTGTSGCVPNIYCVTEDVITCKVCLDAITPITSSFQYRDVDEPDILPDLPPNTLRYSKNRRRNTSGVYRYHHSDGEVKNVVIDCGKVLILPCSSFRHFTRLFWNGSFTISYAESTR